MTSDEHKDDQASFDQGGEFSNIETIAVEELTEDDKYVADKKKKKRDERMAKMRAEEKAGLLMNSLMDIMTILLCFMIKSFGTDAVSINQSDVLRIPQSNSMEKTKDATQITVTSEMIVVGTQKAVNVHRGKVDKSEKRGDENSLYISRLYKALNDQVNYQKKIHSMRGTKFEGIALIVAHKATPYRLLTEVLYTAGQAQFSKFNFVIAKNRPED